MKNPRRFSRLLDLRPVESSRGPSLVKVNTGSRQRMVVTRTSRLLLSHFSVESSIISNSFYIIFIIYRLLLLRFKSELFLVEIEGGILVESAKKFAYSCELKKKLQHIFFTHILCSNVSMPYKYTYILIYSLNIFIPFRFLFSFVTLAYFLSPLCSLVSISIVAISSLTKGRKMTRRDDTVQECRISS